MKGEDKGGIIMLSIILTIICIIVVGVIGICGFALISGIALTLAVPGFISVEVWMAILGLVLLTIIIRIIRLFISIGRRIRQRRRN